MIEKLEIFPKILGIFIPPLPFNSPLRTKRRSQTIERNWNWRHLLHIFQSCSPVAKIWLVMNSYWSQSLVHGYNISFHKKIEIPFRSHTFFQTCQHFHCLVLVAVWWWWTGGEHFSAGSRLHSHNQVWSRIYGSLRHMYHPCCPQHADCYDERHIPRNQGNFKGLVWC